MHESRCDAQLAMNILECTSRLLHCVHRLRIEARRLQGIHLHLQLESRALQSFKLLFSCLLSFQGSGSRYPKFKSYELHRLNGSWTHLSYLLPH